MAARWLREAPHILEGPAVHPRKERHLSGGGSAFPAHCAPAGTTERGLPQAQGPTHTASSRPPALQLSGCRARATTTGPTGSIARPTTQRQPASQGCRKVAAALRPCCARLRGHPPAAARALEQRPLYGTVSPTERARGPRNPGTEAQVPLSPSF